MTDAVASLFDTVATSYGLNLIGIIPSVFTVFFSTRIFAPDVMGQLSLIVVVAAFIQTVGFQWLSSALIRFGREEYIQTGGVRQTFQVRMILLAVILLASLLGFGGLYLLARELLLVRIGLSGRLLWTVPLFLILGIVAGELTGYLRVFDKYVHLAAASLAGQLFQVVAMFLLYRYLGVAGIDWLIVLSVGGAASQILYMMLRLKWKNFRPGASTPELGSVLGSTVSYSRPAIATFLLNCLYKPLEYYLILQFASIAAIGLYSTANSMNGVFVQFVSLFPNLMFPIMLGFKTAGKKEVVKRYYQRVTPQLTLLFALCVSVALICLPPVIQVLLSERYHPAIGAFLILAYGEIPHMAYALESIYSAMYDKLIQTFWATVVQYIFQFAAYFYLIPRIGIEGAAWGWVAAYLASAVVLTYYISEEFGVSLRPYLAIALSSLLGLGALFVARSGIHLILQLVILTVIVTTALVAVKAAKIFERQDADLLMTTGIPRLLRTPLRFAYRILGA